MTIIERLPLIEDLAPEPAVSKMTSAGPAKVAADEPGPVDFDIERVVWDAEYRETIIQMLNVSAPD
tara:strand:- start:783 stop:980 length:198 start_codon:yes stop_codon:yes gene_type:complete